MPFFERVQHELPCLMLNTQYRMHPEISIFPRQHFYGELIDGGNTLEYHQPYYSILPAYQVTNSLVHVVSMNLTCLCVSFSSFFFFFKKNRLKSFKKIVFSIWKKHIFRKDFVKIVFTFSLVQNPEFSLSALFTWKSFLKDKNFSFKFKVLRIWYVFKGSYTE